MEGEVLDAYCSAYLGHPAAMQEAEQSTCKLSVTSRIRHTYSSRDMQSCNGR